MNNLHSFAHCFKFSCYRAKTHIKAESSALFLGILWKVIEPILYLGAFYLIFGLIFQQKGENYAPFLLIGLVVWKWFASSINASINSIQQNMPLIYQVYIPKYVFPLTSIIASIFPFLVVFSILLFALVVIGPGFHMAWLIELPVLIFIQLLFITGVSLILAAVVPFIPDIKFIIDSVLMLLFFLSGIFFKFDQLPDKYQVIFNLNPIGVIISNFRYVLIEGRSLDWSNLMPVTVISIAFLWIGFFLLSKNDRVYAKREFV